MCGGVQNNRPTYRPQPNPTQPNQVNNRDNVGRPECGRPEQARPSRPLNQCDSFEGARPQSSCKAKKPKSLFKKLEKLLKKIEKNFPQASQLTSWLKDLIGKISPPKTETPALPAGPA